MKRREKLLAAEIGIEFKAALYFYSIMFFYFGYKIISGTFYADIVILIEMVVCTYIMGFVQVFMLGNFDEAEKITWKEIIKAVVCSLVYTSVSYLGAWFDRGIAVTVIFFFFVMIFYGCTYWLYSVKRTVSTKELNIELEAFKKKKQNGEEK